MRRTGFMGLLALGVVALTVQTALAGSPHLVGKLTISQSGSTITVSGKEAGLGNEATVHIVFSADALCVNGGGNHPKAVNKTSVGAGDDFPVQNGQALFSLQATATFQPPCDPPMSVVFANITLTDVGNGVQLYP